METVSVNEILEWSKGKLIKGKTDINISSVCIDSKKVQEGSLFVCIEGKNFDSYTFINDALQNGANSFIIDRNHPIPSIESTVIFVDNTIKSLQDIAKNYRRKFSIPIIGVTGSVGKSTTKEMIASVLGSELDVLKTEGNDNGQIGLPLTLLNLESHHEVAVLEMGISEFGEMERLADIADADIGVITNIGISHIQNFKTEENIREEKLKLLKDCQKKYYLNGDSPLLANINEQKFKNVTYFGLNGAYSYRAEDISSQGELSEFVLVTPTFKDNITISCPGIHNVYNALVAIAVGIDMGIHLDDIKSGLLGYKGMKMRQQILKIGNIYLMDDSYNSSPDSIKSSVSVLRTIPSDGKNIVIMSDMLELGERSQDIHYQIGKYMAVEDVNVLITVGEFSKFIYKGACDSSIPIKTIHCETNQDAANQALNILSSGDKILVKGSRGMHMEETVNYLKNVLEKRSE